MTRRTLLLLALLALTACEPPVPPDPPPGPDPPPDGPAMLLCLRPWTCTLDQSDADLIIRESIDAHGGEIRYLSCLPGQPDERMQPHSGIAAYADLAPSSLPYVFHVVPGDPPTIQNQGPLDAPTVLRWVGVSVVDWRDNAQRAAAPGDEWTDYDFFANDPERCGALDEPDSLRALSAASTADVRSLPGFQGLAAAEARAWVERFPLERLYPSVAIHITDQGRYGSCVGHAGINCIEGAEFHAFGVRYFRKLSGMSLYKRIGRSPSSGAYVGDGAAEIRDRGILPATGEPYTHTFSVSGDWSKPLPSGWETTARQWRGRAFRVTDSDAARRVLLDWRYRTHFGRSRHSISGFHYTGKWLYENSWSSGWGSPPGVGYDSRFYDSYTYQPILRTEIPVLVSQ